MNHKLFNQLTDANVDDDEIEELYQDLRFIFDDPFDVVISEAIKQRGVVYIELNQPVAH